MKPVLLGVAGVPQPRNSRGSWGPAAVGRSSQPGFWVTPALQQSGWLWGPPVAASAPPPVWVLTSPPSAPHTSRAAAQVQMHSGLRVQTRSCPWALRLHNRDHQGQRPAWSPGLTPGALTAGSGQMSLFIQHLGHGWRGVEILANTVACLPSQIIILRPNGRGNLIIERWKLSY